MTGWPKAARFFFHEPERRKRSKKPRGYLRKFIKPFEKKKLLTFTSRAFSKLLKNVIVILFYHLRYQFRYLHPFAHL